MKNLSQKWEIKLRNLISFHKLDEVANDILSHSAECLAMIAENKEDYRSIGNTRFGGDPDLPSSIPWPRFGKEKNRLVPILLLKLIFRNFQLLIQRLKCPQVEFYIYL